MQETLLFYTMILLILGVSLKIYLESERFQLKCVISGVDGNEYCVRERQDVNKVADLLASTTQRLKDLVNHMKKEYPDDKNVQQMVENFNPKNVMETLPTSVHTAYSENKGEKIAFCVTKKRNGKRLIDENTLMFVAIHELAHTATKSIGHTTEFWENFKFLLENAKKIGIYHPEDYKKEPREYCGMEITDNPYFDL